MLIWLRELRINAGYTQKDIATQAEITQQFYNYIENGVRHPSVKVAKKISSVLEFDWTRFFQEREHAS